VILPMPNRAETLPETGLEIATRQATAKPRKHTRADLI